MTAVRDPRAAQVQRRHAEALARVLRRVAEQFPELDSREILDAVQGNYVGVHAPSVRADETTPAGLVRAIPQLEPGEPVIRWYRA